MKPSGIAADDDLLGASEPKAFFFSLKVIQFKTKRKQAPHQRPSGFELVVELLALLFGRSETLQQQLDVGRLLAVVAQPALVRQHHLPEQPKAL